MTARTAGVIGAIVGVLTLLAVVVALTVGGSPERLGQLLDRPAAELVAADDAPIAPELTGIAGWHNTTPLTLQGLRGRVVAIDVWTYTCINCRRTFPFLRALHRTYSPRGFTLIGLHSPEFDFEKLSSNVERAVRELDVIWPVAEDPSMDTWEAFHNQYWPTTYVIDKQGRIRLTHIGEGNEDQVENAVRTLLAEEGGDPGPARVGDVAATEQPPDSGERITPEVYLGSARGARFIADGTVKRDDGFEQSADWLTARRPGATLTLQFRARDVYSLLAPASGGPAVTVEVTLDGQPVPAGRRGRDLTATADGRTVLVVDDDDLRHVVTGSAIGSAELRLVASAAGARFVTFTFGA